MEALMNINTDYTLECGLDVLHKESKSWLDELAFMQNELEFYLKLLRSKFFESKDEKQRQHIYENMENLCSVAVQELITETKAHERNLARLMNGKEKESDDQYRHKHQQLMKKMIQLDKDTKNFKMLVFLFLKDKA